MEFCDQSVLSLTIVLTEIACSDSVSVSIFHHDRSFRSLDLFQLRQLFVGVSSVLLSSSHFQNILGAIPQSEKIFKNTALLFLLHAY